MSSVQCVCNKIKLWMFSVFSRIAPRQRVTFYLMFLVFKKIISNNNIVKLKCFQLLCCIS